MKILLITLSIVLALLWVASNIFITRMLSAKQMHDEFISGQCFVGKICANIFYAPAWALKGLRYVVVYAIK